MTGLGLCKTQKILSQFRICAAQWDGVMRHCQRLSRETVSAPGSLEMSKARLDGIWSTQVQGKGAGGGMGWALRFFPTQIILGFHRTGVYNSHILKLQTINCVLCKYEKPIQGAALFKGVPEHHLN